MFGTGREKAGSLQTSPTSKANDEKKEVFLVEGEKDADSLNRW